MKDLLKRQERFQELIDNLHPDDFLYEVRLRLYTQELEKIRQRIKKYLSNPKSYDGRT